MVTAREPWLSQVTEEALEPDLPICDPHHHLWDRPNNRYLLDDLLGDIGGGHNITHTVFIETSAAYRQDGPEEMRPVGETEFVQRIAAENARRPGSKTNVAAGIVGFADLTLGDRVTPVLEAHIQAGKGRFRGVRNTFQWDADPAIRRYPTKGMALDPRVRQSVTALRKLGLSYDALFFFHQLPEMAELVKGLPDLPIILNHVGCVIGVGAYAGKRDEVMEAWKRNISTLAPFPNVFVKLGGLGMPRWGFAFHERAVPPTSEELAQAWGPYLLFCVEKFGADRCMFESNFPVDKVTCSYTVIWNAFKRITAGCSASEKAALFRGTAARAYRLDTGDRKQAAGPSR